MGNLIPIEEAQRLVLERASRLPAERVPIERAYGRVLADPAASTCDLPPFPSSAMDGYALCAADTAAAPVTLPLGGRVAAGSPASTPLPAGHAMGVATGAVVPDGADAVVPLELVTEEDGKVRIAQAISPGANVRPRAGDAAAGAAVLPAGTVLGPVQVGALAAAGVTEVQCARRPRVGILVTGSELRPPGSPLGPGEIYESNGLMLAALLVSAGAVPAQLGTVADDPDEHRTAMERALLGFDMLVTSGGVSVGPHDLVRSVQASLGVTEVFWGVAVKPGKPVAFGVRRDHLAFSLPGNPVSALVCFELFVRVAINALLGVADPLPAFAWGRLAEPAARNGSRDEFLRARVVRTSTGASLTRAGGQESHMIVAAGQADALVHVPRGDGELPAGCEARYIPLG